MSNSSICPQAIYDDILGPGQTIPVFNNNLHKHSGSPRGRPFFLPLLLGLMSTVIFNLYFGFLPDLDLCTYGISE